MTNFIHVEIQIGDCYHDGHFISICIDLMIYINILNFKSYKT